MPSVEIMGAFLVATVIFGYMPGPALLYTAAQTIAGGRRAGFRAAMGLHVGGYTHVFAAAFGLATLFALVPTAYLLLKLAGAAYLIWLGVRLVTSTRKKSFADKAPPTAPAFRNSMLVEMLNPKTALFYVAFLPQFTDPGAAWPVWAQLAVLGTIVNVVFSSADVICVLLADRLTAALRASARAQIWAARIGGAILVGLGLKLALEPA